jgi:hypothetical protein
MERETAVLSIYCGDSERFDREHLFIYLHLLKRYILQPLTNTLWQIRIHLTQNMSMDA